MKFILAVLAIAAAASASPTGTPPVDNPVITLFPVDDPVTTLESSVATHVPTPTPKHDSCTRVCAPQYDPIRCSNGVTYNNTCEFEHWPANGICLAKYNQMDHEARGNPRTSESFYCDKVEK
ncbi:hypothetical protein CCM_03644 [Cordyceps militaris CM01]|uniref:Uncharacterized protein n=1 Tax=Cordyceps militaris (strain CM01) TaxID=983644 RepID=G3JFP1_CORMM|nr:uncharacterized protein CCM_03644 [Cordyceps militaris CM01]EGX92274.1 hypothetical protein CCM_03644 [Cordyceps militaris CM01]